MAEKAGLVVTCILGGFFLIIGSVNFLTDHQPSIHPIADGVFNVAFIIGGFLAWAAVLFRYGGGFWSIVGAFLVAGALTGTISIVETRTRGWHFDTAFYVRIAICWIVGVAFLLMGHRRHRRKNQMRLEKTPETP